ncbi:MAG: deoxyguanosinetriphosphate triphosphohydrolase [Clostridia bacterium]|nr:deoxyguanosinetriphosphate triphosphohydrolase [Clostridia bacterium]MEE1023903.1 deoxyguanosinetriphosphate triphosphohydrolase [Acutalibacteraceae bacterium]
MPCVRDIIEQNEKNFLCEYATLSVKSMGRSVGELKCDLRTDFQRDRDRIIHSASFRRLKHKTQVYIAPEGDHYRTRLTHTLEVSQIARTISRALFLNEDLTEAIAMGHDLGHTPFGHAGERALNSCLDGGFRHYEQSVRVVQKLEKSGKGLNLTYEVEDGILKHTNMDAATREGQIVRLADRIAYMNHDIDDSIKAGILTEEDIPIEIRQGLGFSKSARIDTMTKAVISHGAKEIGTDEYITELMDKLHKFMFDAVYTNPIAKGEESKAQSLIITLFDYFSKNPDKLPEEYHFISNTEGPKRASADYIAGMTDRYVVNIYNSLFIPKSWMVL